MVGGFLRSIAIFLVFFGGLGAGFPLPTWATVEGGKWDLEDVAILFPLSNETNKTTHEPINSHSSGRKGDLLPESAFAQIPTLLLGGAGNPTLYRLGLLHVVAMRIDPCSPIVSGNCGPFELRLVWQPVLSGSAKDAAIHTFYRIPSSEVGALMRELRDLKTLVKPATDPHPRRALWVHSAFSADEATRRFFTEQIQAVILKYCGSDNLYKITFMSEFTPSLWWRFGGFERAHQGEWATLAIPRLTDTITDVFNVAAEPDQDSIGEAGQAMDGTINILPDDYPESDRLEPVINKSFRFNDERDLAVFQDKMSALARFQNPERTNPLTLDCAACHLADPTKYYVTQRFPKLSSFVTADDFLNPDPSYFNLSRRTSPQHATRNLRAFGYFRTEPAVSQRVINDAAASAHWLNTPTGPLEW